MKLYYYLMTAVIMVVVTILFLENSGFRYASKPNVKPQHYKTVKPKTKCLKNSFGDIIVVLNYNYANYENIKILRKLYNGIFGRVISCGPMAKPGKRQPDIVYRGNATWKGVPTWYYRYTCLNLAYMKHPNFKGYLYSNDDVIMNPWNFLHFDKRKLWQGNDIDWNQTINKPIVNPKWLWWKTRFGLKACEKYWSALKVLSKKDLSFKNSFHKFLTNNNGISKCGKGWADTWYVPKRLMKMFIKLSIIAKKSELISELAIHIIFASLDLKKNIENLHGIYLHDVRTANINLWLVYNLNLTFVHPVKYNNSNKRLTLALIDNWILDHKRKLMDQCESI